MMDVALTTTTSFARDAFFCFFLETADAEAATTSRFFARFFPGFGLASVPGAESRLASARSRERRCAGSVTSWSRLAF
jgi:hypothetical protein